MEIKDEITLLHLLKDWVVDLVRLDSTIRVGGDASGVRLDANNACLLCLSDFFGSEVWREVEGH